MEHPVLGVKIQNLIVDFKTGGTWRQVGRINKNREAGRFLFTLRPFETIND